MIVTGISMVGVLYWRPIGHSHRALFSFGVEDTYFCRLVHKWFQKHLLETVAFKGLENSCSVSKVHFHLSGQNFSQLLEVSFSLLSPKLLFRAFQVAGERQNASPPPFTSPLSLSLPETSARTWPWCGGVFIYHTWEMCGGVLEKPSRSRSLCPGKGIPDATMPLRKGRDSYHYSGRLLGLRDSEQLGENIKWD